MSFRRYAAYTDSGVEWLGAIPKHWILTPLKRVVISTNAGEVIDRGFWGGHLEVLYTCAIDPLDCDYVGFPNWKRTTADDLLLTRNGTPYVHKPLENAIYTNVVQRIRLQSGLNRNYMAVALQNSADNLRGYGVSIESLNYEMWKVLPLAIPPLAEQVAIAAFLEHETAKVDALIHEQRRLIDLLIEKRHAIIARSVTCGLNAKATTKESGVAWLGRVPEKWTSHLLGRLFVQQKRQGFAEKEVLSVYRDYGVIQKDSRTDNFNKTPEDLSSYQLVDPDDLVVNKMKAWQGSLGISRFEGITSPDYIVFTPRHEQLPEYLHILLRSQPLVSIYRSISNGIRPSQWRLEPDSFLSLTVFLPPLEEQRAIVGFIEDVTAKMDALIAEAEKAIGLLSERRVALISAAVTGKFDVRGLVTAPPEREAAA